MKAPFSSRSCLYLSTVMLVVGVSTVALQAQPALVNIRAEVDQFRFEIDSAEPAFSVEAAPDQAGPWSLLEEVDEPSFVTPISEGQRFFRVRAGDSYSEVAGYARVTFPASYACVANPFDHESNRLEDLLPQLPDGTTLFFFDAETQQWEDPAQFAWGSWTAPDKVWEPLRGAFIACVEPTTVTFVGRLPEVPAPNPPGAEPFIDVGGSIVRQGWNLVGTYDGAFQVSANESFQVYVFFTPAQTYNLFSFQMGMWTPDEPTFNLTQGAWIKWQDGSPVRLGAVWVNNFDPIFGIDVVYPFSTDIRAQLAWGAQGTAAGSLQPVGEPLTFRSGPAAGYLNPELRYVPDVPAGGMTADVQLRFWDSRSGATYQEATIRGETSVNTINLPGAGEPPILPSALVGLTSYFNMGLLAYPRVEQQVEESFLFDAIVGGTVSGRLKVQWSSDLKNWTDLAPDLDGAPGKSTIADPIDSSVGSKFYRLIETAGE